MTTSEGERLVLEIQALIERRERLLAALNTALRASLTQQEVADIQRVLGEVEAEKRDLERRLALVGGGQGPAGRGTGS